MSYYKLKSVSFKKDGKLFVTIADSSIRPIYYTRVEYAGKENMDPRQKIAWLAKDIWSGEVQPNRSCNHSDWWKACESAAEYLGIKHTNMDADFRWKLDRLTAIQILAAEKIFTPLFFGEEIPEEAWEAVRNFDKESELAYEKRKQEFDKANIIPIYTAIRSNVLEDADVLYTYDDRILLVHADHYVNAGLLDNSDGSAIDITALPYDPCLRILQYRDPNFYRITEEQEKQIPWEMFVGFKRKQRK